jgi:S-phase kinase-associated protein 1
MSDAKEENLSLDDEIEVEGQIELQSQDDGQKFSVEKKNAYISVLIKQSLASDASATAIPLQVKDHILAKIVDYMNHHKGSEPAIIEKPLRSKEMKAVVKDEWDATFIDDIDGNGSTRQDLYDIILAANYLNINGLLNLGCAKVASLIKGQPLEQIKEILSKGTSREGKTETQEKKESA